MRLAPSFFVLLATAAPAIAAETTGQDLARWCSLSAARQYIAGVVDQSRWSYDTDYCVPPKARPQDAADIVCAFVEGNPNTISYPAPWQVREALKKRWACPDPNEAPIEVPLLKEDGDAQP